MPEAMLLAKLTLCSHGNGSCWPPVRKEKTKRKESKCLHQMSKRAKLYPRKPDYSVLNSSIEWGALSFTWEHTFDLFWAPARRRAIQPTA